MYKNTPIQIELLCPTLRRTDSIHGRYYNNNNNNNKQTNLCRIKMLLISLRVYNYASTRTIILLIICAVDKSLDQVTKDMANLIRLTFDNT